MKTKGYKRVSQEDFNYVKQLKDAGITAAAIHKLTKRSLTTVNRLLNSSSFDEYQKATKIYNENYLNKRNNKASEPEVKAEKVTVQEDNAAVHTKEPSSDVIELARIANALERLADAWENSPKKRTLF